MTEAPAKITDKLSAAVEKMPAFPKSVQRVLEITRDINLQPKELVSVIEKDPVMTMKLLRIINSAYYNFPKQVTTVNQALVYLGLNTVKNMALSFAAAGVLPQQNAAGFDMQRYLMHSLTTASLARMVCQKFGGDADPGDCYLAGLLHDFGKVVFAQFMPGEFREALAICQEQAIPLHLAERQAIGVDHSVVGAMLVEKWQFPKLLADAINRHHGDISPENTMLCSLFVADQISKKLSMGHSGNLVVDELPPALVDRFGGNIDGIIARLGDLSRVAEEAQSFAKIGTEATA
ncbi:MAG: metal dependent phosphohydrolase [Gallionellaceae bacterium]|nr:MAG: metal dependent phosphohydrolase [Gallionellaceae bacterium]